MLTITDAQAKDGLDEYIDEAKHQPVFIKNPAGDQVVIIDRSEYERLRSMDEAYWRLKADFIDQAGTVCETRPNIFMQKR